MHIPSFLIGSTVTGVGFLLIDRELSHRQRLSNRWVLCDKVEDAGNKLWQEAKKSISGSNDPTTNFKSQSQDVINKLNNSIESVAKNVRKYFSN